MSEEIPAILAEPAVLPVQTGSLGASLRSARESLGLDLDAAAAQLRMSARQIMALESDNIASLPSPTFTRGFIRNYARLLKLDAEPLLAIYRGMLPDNDAGSSISLHSEDIPILTGNASTWLPYVALSVLLGVALGGWWVYMDWRESEVKPPAVAEKQASPETLPTAPAVADPPLETSAVESAPQPLPELSQNSLLTVPLAEPATATPAASGIGLKFSQESWVRVLDRDGKEIFHKNSPGNSEDSVDGIPPFKIEIGNAAGVQVSYKGQLVELAPHTKANVARLTLE